MVWFKQGATQRRLLTWLWQVSGKRSDMPPERLCDPVLWSPANLPQFLGHARARQQP